MAIVRALINNPKIILADEPTGNLDPENGEIIMALLKKLCRMGKTVIIVSHNIEHKNSADLFVELKDGRIVG